jgi:hypothetical protein
LQNWCKRVMTTINSLLENILLAYHTWWARYLVRMINPLERAADYFVDKRRRLWYSQSQYATGVLVMFGCTIQHNPGRNLKQ